MATVSKTKTAVTDATAQVQELTELVAETSKKAAAQYLTLAETATQSVVGFQREVAEKTDIEWVASLINAQAQLTGEVGKVWVSAGRELIK
jgi:hypothetical protein